MVPWWGLRGRGRHPSKIKKRWGMADKKIEVSLDLWGIFWAVLLVVILLSDCGNKEFYIKKSVNQTTIGMSNKEGGGE